MKMRFYKWLDKMLLKRFNKVIAVSEVLRGEILKSGIPTEKVVVVNNGIDINRFQGTSHPSTALRTGKSQVKEEFRIKENEKVIGTVGRLTLEKGHIYLLKAIKKIIAELPDTKFLIVGDGCLMKSLGLEVENLKLEDKVIFTGIRNDISEMLNLMDIFVMPSLKEGTPIALLEAMAAKKSVIASRVGAIPKVIEDGYTGLLVEAGNVRELSDSIIGLLKDKEKADFLAQNGYEKVKSEFSARKMAEKYITLYASVL